MKIFDWHIIKRFSTILMMLLLMLTFIFLLLDFLEHIDDFITNRASVKDIGAFYLNYIPDILHLISPAAVFLSCVYLTGRLAQELQITALYTSGVSIYRLFLPFMSVAMLMTTFVFVLSGWVVPKTNIQKLELSKKYLNQTQSDELEKPNNIFRELRPNVILNIGYYNKELKNALNVSILEFDQSKRLKKRLDANQMQWLDKSNQWRMTKVVTRWFDAKGETHATTRETLDTLRVLPQNLARTTNDVALLSLPDARQYVQELAQSGLDNTGQSFTQYYSKFTYPLANIIVILLGISLAATRRKGGQAVQMAIGLIVAFVYLAFMKIAEPFGYSGELDPLLTVTLPHLFFLLIGMILLFFSRK